MFVGAVVYKKIIPFPYKSPNVCFIILSEQQSLFHFYMDAFDLTFMAALCLHILQINAIKLPSTCCSSE